jgi:hypothetical protein
MHRDGDVSQHRLGTRCRDREARATCIASERISDVIEISGLVLVLCLFVAQ